MRQNCPEIAGKAQLHIGGVYNLIETKLFEGDLRRIAEERYINYYSDENT